MQFGLYGEGPGWDDGVVGADGEQRSVVYGEWGESAGYSEGGVLSLVFRGWESAVKIGIPKPVYLEIRLFELNRQF